MDSLASYSSPPSAASHLPSPTKPSISTSAAEPASSSSSAAPPLVPSPPPIFKNEPSPARPTPPPPPPQLDWPFNHPGLLCYFDPFSPKAAALHELLERKAQKQHSLPFPSTALATSATHLILDPECELNACFRTGQKAFVVSLDWAKDSFFNQVAADEGEYRVGEVGKGKAEEEDEKEEESSKDGRRPGSDYVSGIFSGNGWRLDEEEELAVFLASRPEPTHLTIWQQFALTHPRSAKGYEEHYRIRKKVLDKRVREINGEDEPAEVSSSPERDLEEDEDEEEEEEKDHGKTRRRGSRGDSSESEFDESSDGDIGGSSTKHNSRGRIPSTDQAWSYSAEEQAYLIKVLSRSDLTQTAMMEQFARKYKKRSPNSALQHYYYYRSYYDRKSGKGGGGSGSSSSSEGSESESDNSLASARRPSSNSLGKRPQKLSRVRYTEEENAHLRRLIRKAGGTFSLEVAEELCQAYPKRNPHAVQQHYSRRKDVFDRAMAEDLQESKKHEEPGASEHDGSKRRWTEDEDRDLAALIVQTSGPKMNAFNKMHAKHPSRSLIAIGDRYRKNGDLFDTLIKSYKKKNGSTSNAPDSDDDEPLASGSTAHAKSHHRRASEPQPGPPSSKRARFEEEPSSSSNKNKNVGQSSSSSARPRHSYPSTSASSSSYQHAKASGSNSHSSNPPPKPTHTSRRPRSPSPSSGSGSDLEPETFLSIGVPPRSCPPTALFCFFCGTYRRTNFSPLALAARREGSDEIVRVADRTACEFCKGWYERRMVKGEKLGPGVREMGEVERLAWVTEKLLEKGLKLRREDVFGE